ncbi:minor capsid protein [Clostridium sp. BJN0001]|uniref:minor capsid protein n=1 Tax=Clostridium sp. BJN0001 TaxID=2930219 RepID=UPI001FD1681F|nr:minor capsid protein [Clostridium sp. BJN0001]
MNVKVDIKLYSDKIGILENASKQAFEMTVEAVLTDIVTSAVVPKDTGTLEESGFTDIKNMIGKIIFDTPYARRLYWHPEFNFRHDKNVNAQGKWMETYIDGPKKQWIIDTYGKFFKQLSKGVIY